METCKTPQNGYVCNYDDGAFFIGSDKDAGSTRTRQVELRSTSNACLKLFEDGGWEIQSASTSKSADSIVSRSKEGLNIKNTGDGIRIDAGGGTLTLAARTIRFESSGSDQNFKIKSTGNIELDADDSLILNGSVVAVGAKTRMLLNSVGPIKIFSNAGVSIVEPKTSLCPSGLLESVQNNLSLFPFN